MVVVEVLEASVLVVLVEVLGTILDPRLVLEAAVRVWGTMGVLVHLGEDLVEISLGAAAALAVVAGSRLPVDRARRDPLHLVAVLAVLG